MRKLLLLLLLSGFAAADTHTKSSGSGTALPDVTNTATATVGLNGAVTTTGTLTINQVATPSAPSLVVTGGVGTNYSYKVVCKVGAVGSAASAAASTAAGPTTLDGTHFIDINFTAQTGCTSYDIYRTVGGAAQGKIGNVAGVASGGALTLRDNALVGDASTAPAADTGTGGEVAQTLQVGTTPGTATGTINIPSGLYLTSRNNANNGNVNLIRANGSDLSEIANLNIVNDIRIAAAAAVKMGTTILISNTAPTISTHFNTSSDSITANGSGAFKVTVGTGTAGSTGSLTLPTATTGWACWLANQTRGAYIQQTSNTTTSATFTNYGTTVGTPVNWTNSDVLVGGCVAF